MSCYTKRSSTRRSDDTMDDDTEDKDDTKRKSRNLSEKKRRDQFNMLVNELSSMVSTGARKMDKSTVLKATISFLKNHNEITLRSRAHEIQEDWKPAFLSNEEFTHLILEALDGFIVVFSAAGHVHYVSESVTALLGHLPSDLLNTSVYELIWDEEQATLYQALSGGGSGPEGQLAFQAHLRRGGGGSPPSSPQDPATANTTTPAPANEPATPDQCYELVNFVGYLRTDVDMVDSTTSPEGGGGVYSGEADTRLFVGTGRLQTPQLIREMSLVDAADMAAAVGGGAARGGSGEFTSRHSLEWKFLFLDHRAPPIIGYLPFEVLGTSGYDYYHVDDLDKVVSCHEALMQKGEGTSCYYRFLTKGQQWIWLQTRFYITYHQWNSKPEFIVCTHRVVSYVDVMKQSRKDREAGAADVEDTSPRPAPGSGTSSPWRASSSAASTKGLHHHPRRTTAGTPSDCTSMSADSPTSRHSQHHHQPPQQQQQQQQQHQQQQPQIIVQHNGGKSEGVRLTNQGGVEGALLFPEPTQYVAAIPVQPAVIASFPAPASAAVLSPLPHVVDTGGGLVFPNDSHLQAQLQRKHAELQAIIGQQQAELRRVSEQLLMARLGLLPAPDGSVTHLQQQQHPQQQQQQQHQQLLNVSVPYVCNSNVSSTTTVVSCAGALPVPISVSVPIAAVQHPYGASLDLHHSHQRRQRQADEQATMSMSQQQAQMLFAAPNSSTPQHK